jgi:hypothetical protein
MMGTKSLLISFDTKKFHEYPAKDAMLIYNKNMPLLNIVRSSLTNIESFNFLHIAKDAKCAAEKY